VTLAAPEQVSAGQEFVVSVAVAGADALPPAELELNYDPAALEPVDEGDKSGTRVLKLSKGGGAVDVRFRILAQKPVTTQISIGNVSFKDESGPLPVPVPLPPAVNVDIR
jgi:general secretion pathway protein D